MKLFNLMFKTKDGFNLTKLEKSLDNALEKETTDSIIKFHNRFKAKSMTRDVINFVMTNSSTRSFGYNSALYFDIIDIQFLKLKVSKDVYSRFFKKLKEIKQEEWTEDVVSEALEESFYIQLCIEDRKEKHWKPNIEAIKL